jgi:NADH-quinone oxidoreductase subunit M
VTLVPFALLLLASTAVAALVAATMRSEAAAHRAAVAGAALVVATAVAAGAAYRLDGPLLQFGSALVVVPGYLTLRVALDGEAIVLAALLGVVSLATLVAMPRVELRRADVLATLAVTGAGLLVATSRDLLSLSAGWVAALLPGTALALGSRSAEASAEAPVLRRAHRALLIGASLPVLAAVVVVVVEVVTTGHTGLLDLEAASGAALDPAWQRVVVVLLGLGALVRTAVVPLHGWLPSLLARGHASPVIVLASAPVGAVLLSRVAAPVFPGACAELFPTLAWISVISAVVASLLAVVQLDLLRTVAYVVVAQESMALVGIGTLDVAGVTGGLLQSLTTGMSASGLIVLSWALVARTGTGDMRRLGGLWHDSPRLGALWLLIGVATVGFPGTLGFVGEDLLVQGLLGGHPAQAALLILATALDAVAFFRAYARSFLGPRSVPEAGGPALDLPDLLPRKRVIGLVLLGLVLGGGAYPQPVLALVATGYGAVAAVTRPHR